MESCKLLFNLLIWSLCHVASGEGSEVQPPPPHPTLATSMGWQYGKSLADCNRYMLEQQLATDIGFLVGPRGEARSLIRAHRYVLLSRSAVFTRLLQQNNAIDKDLLPAASSEYRNTTLPSGHPLQTIEIPDMNPAVFRQLLNFVYTESANLDLHNVIPLMYAAKKYQLPTLINECQKVLQQNISIENVCIILNQAVYFNEEELINKSLNFIGFNAGQVLESHEFLELSYDAFKEVISYDKLDLNEAAVFQYSMLWAEAKLLKKNVTVNDNSERAIALRSILGEVVYHIRFPILNQKEFADLVGTSDLLTCGEKASIYYYIATADHMNNTLAFDYEGRVRRRILDRFKAFTASSWGCGGQVNKIQLTVNKSVFLKGIGTYQIGRLQNVRQYQHYNHYVQQYVEPSPGDKFTFSVSISRSSQRFGTSRYSEVTVGGNPSFNFTKAGQEKSHIIEIPLKAGVKLEPNNYYTISLQLTGSEFCFSGAGTNNGGSSIQDNDVTFTFYNAGTSTQTNQGQIPRLIYYSM